MITCPFQVPEGKRVYGLRNSNLSQINGSRYDFRMLAEVAVVCKYLWACEILRHFKPRSLRKFLLFLLNYTWGSFVSQSCTIDCPDTRTAGRSSKTRQASSLAFWHHFQVLWDSVLPKTLVSSGDWKGGLVLWFERYWRYHRTVVPHSVTSANTII